MLKISLFLTQLALTVFTYGPWFGTTFTQGLSQEHRSKSILQENLTGFQTEHGPRFTR